MCAMAIVLERAMKFRFNVVRTGFAGFDACRDSSAEEERAGRQRNVLDGRQLHAPVEPDSLTKKEYP